MKIKNQDIELQANVINEIARRDTSEAPGRTSKAFEGFLDGSMKEIKDSLSRIGGISLSMYTQHHSLCSESEVAIHSPESAVACNYVAVVHFDRPRKSCNKSVQLKKI